MRYDESDDPQDDADASPPKSQFPVEPSTQEVQQRAAEREERAVRREAGRASAERMWNEIRANLAEYARKLR